MNLLLHYPPFGIEPYTMFRYPGGEIQVRLNDTVQEKIKNPIVETVTVLARITDGDIIPVAQLINAIRGCTSADIKLVLPYLPYGRADRRFVGGDTHGLQVFGQLLNTFAGVEIITLDVHSPEASKYIRHFTNISPQPLIEHAINMIDGTMKYGSPIITTAVLLPDKGAARYGYHTKLICEKIRDPQTGKLSGFKVPDKQDFKCDNILIIDDICDGGGTFLGIAKALRDVWVDKSLYLYVTHGIFSQGLGGLRQHFDGVFTTDSFRHWNEYEASEFLTVMSCSDLLIGGVK